MNDSNHNERAHALLSPSSAERWMACPGSIRLGIGIPDPPTSEFALEGTWMHEQAEKLLRASDFEYAWHLKKLYAENPELAESIHRYVLFCSDLQQAFTSVFEQAVSDTDPSYRYSDDCEFRRFIEFKVKLSEKIWGTADFVLVGRRNGKLEIAVVDLKGGAGVQKKAENNPQLIIYGLAVAKELNLTPDKIRLYIYQPRGHSGDPVKRAVLEKEDIEAWKQIIEEAEEMCFSLLKEPNDNYLQTLNAGDHCRFCKCAPTCPELHKDSLAIIAPIEIVQNNSMVQIGQLTEVMKRKKQIEHMLDSVEAYLTRCLESGLEVPGFKLVQSRGKRSWAIKNKNELAARLSQKGLTAEQVFKPGIINLGEAEKILGKGAIDDLVLEPIVRNQIVAISDERDEVETNNLIEAIE